MKSPTNEPLDVLAILLEENNQAFAGALGQWRMRFARDYEEAEAILQEGSVEVIVSEYRIDGRHLWRDLLKTRSGISQPLVIVVNRNADERMWGEVLAEGAFDLLRESLDRTELHRVLSEASMTMSDRRKTPEDSTRKERAAAA